jgi:paraquat-inducible protein B
MEPTSNNNGDDLDQQIEQNNDPLINTNNEKDQNEEILQKIDNIQTKLSNLEQVFDNVGVNNNYLQTWAVLLYAIFSYFSI